MNTLHTVCTAKQFHQVGSNCKTFLVQIQLLVLLKLWLFFKPIMEILTPNKTQCLRLMYSQVAWDKTSNIQ